MKILERSAKDGKLFLSLELDGEYAPDFKGSVGLEAQEGPPRCCGFFWCGLDIYIFLLSETPPIVQIEIGEAQEGRPKPLDLTPKQLMDLLGGKADESLSKL